MQLGGGSLAWKWSKEGTRLSITHRRSKGRVWLPEALQLSHCLPDTCSFGHFPLGEPHWGMAVLLIQPPQPARVFCTAHSFPWVVSLLPAIFQCCLCRHLLPNASSLLGPQLVPPAHILQTQPVWEVPRKGARNKNRNPYEFCISVSYVAHLCVVLEFLLLSLFTVLHVFKIKQLGFFFFTVNKNVVSLKH